MLYRRFGKTGIEVSQLVFGGGAVGGLLIDQDEETRLKAVQRAMDAGINWVDTAPSYGRGKSEESLGELLGQVSGDPFISTKFNIDPASSSKISDQIRQSLEQSLTRLRRSSVTLLQLHNRIGETTDGRTLSPATILGGRGVLDSLERLKSEGLIDHFGVTALGETKSILEVIESGSIASAQVYFNLLNPSAARKVSASWPVYDFFPILNACRENGVAAMNIRVFSAGIIATNDRTGRERPLTPGDSIETETAKAGRMFDTLGDQYGTRAQTAIRFALSHDALSCVIFGLAELSHLDEAIEAEKMGALPASALIAIDDVYNSA